MQNTAELVLLAAAIVINVDLVIFILQCTTVHAGYYTILVLVTVVIS